MSTEIAHYYVYSFRDGRYFYERTCGSEEAAQTRVKELGPQAVYLIDHILLGAFY